MRIPFLLFLILLACGLSAQTVVTELPVHFGQYFNNPGINPAKSGSEGNIELYAGNRRNSGNFGGTTTSLFSAFFRLKSQKGSFHVIGASFNNDKEGQFLSRNRLYLTYARHQKLSEQWFLAGGIALGMYNFSIKPNPATEGISAAAFDGNSGICLYSDNTRLGFSVNQFNNATVQPVDQIIQLNRHFYFIGERDVKIKEDFEFSPSLFTRYIENNDNPFLQQWGFGGGINFLINDIIAFGTTYEETEGFYAFLGIQNINMAFGENKEDKINKLHINLSYFMPSSANYRTNIQSFELILRYFVGKN